MPISHEKSVKDSTIIPNELINDLNVPSDTKIILIYLLSKVPPWAVLRSAIKDEYDIDDYVLTRVFEQLEEAGYLTFKTFRNKQDQLVRYGYEVFGKSIINKSDRRNVVQVAQEHYPDEPRTVNPEVHPEELSTSERLQISNNIKRLDFDTANNILRDVECNPNHINSPLLWKEYVYLSAKFSQIRAKKEEKDRATRETNENDHRNLHILQGIEDKKILEQFKGTGPTTALKFMNPI